MSLHVVSWNRARDLRRLREDKLASKEKGLGVVIRWRVRAADSGEGGVGGKRPGKYVATKGGTGLRRGSETSTQRLTFPLILKPQVSRYL